MCARPSGISYVLENRAVMMRTFPDAFQAYEVLPVNHYPAELARILRSISPRGGDDAQIVLLTPGIYNSAYFEHSFLAQQMGIELVEGRDLIVDGGIVYMKTIHGLTRVDVIYRRVDDEFLDSLTFRRDSVLGVPGLMGAYRAGNVALANAVGNGVADDKAIYAYVPTFIRYYLGEDPILRSVDTYLCSKRDDLAYVLEHLSELVVKAVGESGGYGMLMGPTADRARIEEFDRQIRGRPAKLHCAARGTAFTRAVLRSRARVHRTDAMWTCGLIVSTTAENVTIVPGGLTRVALQADSLVVNSSQGGGSKDNLDPSRRGLKCCLASQNRFSGCHGTSSGPSTTARILDVNFHTLLEQSRDRYRLRWEPLIVMAGEEERFRRIYDEANAPAVFEFLAFSQDNPSSIMQCIAKARENARTIRDCISREMWEDLNGLYFTVNRFISGRGNGSRSAPLLRCNPLRQPSLSFTA